jgi:hypothetical protein
MKQLAATQGTQKWTPKEKNQSVNHVDAIFRNLMEKK